MHFMKKCLKGKRKEKSINYTDLASVFPQGMTLLEIYREIGSWGGENLMGHPVRVVDARCWVGRPAYLTALRARAYSAAQLSAKETGWQKKKKKSSSACDSRCLNPAAGRLSPHCWTVSP